MLKLVSTFLLSCVLAHTAGATNHTVSVSTFGVRSGSVVTSSNPVTGINCGSTNTTCSAWFPEGSTITLTSTASSTMTFAGWWGTNGCTNNRPTCDIYIDDNKSLKATYNPNLAIRLSGVGLGTVTDSTGTATCSASSGGCVDGSTTTVSFASGTYIVLTETAGSSSTFTGWTTIPDLGCGTASTCTFSLGGYYVVVATFTSSGPYTIRVSKGGTGTGTVTSSPAGIDCGPTCQYEFDADTVVTLEAEAADGSVFKGWANAGCSGTDECTVISSSTVQGLGGRHSPAAFFYPE